MTCVEWGGYDSADYFQSYVDKYGTLLCVLGMSIVMMIYIIGFQWLFSIQWKLVPVSGWADGYTNSVFRLMEHLDVPRKGLVGPWGHIYPHFGRPGPAIDFLSDPDVGRFDLSSLTNIGGGGAPMPQAG